jgi:hypothetical protein
MFKTGLFKALMGLLCAALFFPSGASGQNIVNWVGRINSDWHNAANWSSGFVPGASDLVQIGVASFVNQPVVNTNSQVGMLTFGGQAPVTLNILQGAVLQVGDKIIQSHSTSQNAAQATITGTGSITCKAVFVGNNQSPRILRTKPTTFISRISTFMISDSLTLYSTTTDLLSGGIAHNNSKFSLEAGQLTVGSAIRLENQIPLYLDLSQTSKPTCEFLIDITSDQDAQLNVSGNGFLKIINPAFSTVDFYHYTGGRGKSTVNYQGGDQLVYTNTFAGLNQEPATYQNLTVSGSGVKTAGSDSVNNVLAVVGDLKVNSGMFDLSAFQTFTLVDSNVVNKGTLKLGSKAIFNGKLFFNSGIVEPGNGLVQFSGALQSLKDSSATGTRFNNLLFNNGYLKTINSGIVSVIPNGLLSIGDATQLNIIAGGRLFLRADSTGTAHLTPLPANASITGQADVEYFIQGSPGSTSARHFNLLSSAVNHTGGLTGIRDFNLNYIFGTNDYNGSPFAGPLENGFQNSGNAASILIYREDVPTINQRSIAKINYPDPNDFGSQSRDAPNNSNLADTVIRLHIGTGLFVYFRGNKTNNHTTTGTKLVSPYNYPESVTYDNRGTINQGTVDFRYWYKQDNYLSYGGPTAASRGHNQLGNPYPAAVNWDRYSASDPSSGIFGQNVSATVKIYNGVTNQYNTYIADASHDLSKVYHGTGIATNIIESGMGFGVTALNNTATLRFSENGKLKQSLPPLSRPLLQPAQPLARGVTRQAGKQAVVNVPNGQPIERVIRMKLVQDSISNDEILIRFNKGYGRGFRDSEDSQDPGGTPEATTMLSSFSADHMQLDINSLPLPADTERISLFTDALATGTYSLQAFRIENIPLSYYLKLKDKMTGSVTDLRNNPSYSFSIDKSESRSYGERFELIITRYVNVN